VVSAYCFLEKGGFDKHDGEWFDKELGAFSGFGDFVRCWLNRQNIWKKNHFRPQYHYMLDNRRRVPLDFVGFLENMEDDFSYICKRLRVKAPLQRVNKSEHGSYQDYYDEQTREIVREVYAEDIQMLGYTFDNSSIPVQLVNRSKGKKFTLPFRTG
jgi:hypothetical protein